MRIATNGTASGDEILVKTSVDHESIPEHESKDSLGNHRVTMPWNCGKCQIGKQRALASRMEQGPGKMRIEA